MTRNTFFAFLLLGFALCSADQSSAQTKAVPVSPSLLYQVTGKGLAKPSYIFGTFHAICPTDMVPFATLDPYLARTDQVLMELDLDDPSVAASVAGSIMIPNGKTLKDFLTAEQFAKVDAMTMSLLGYSAENVKTIKPMILSMLISISPKAAGCTPVTYDTSLSKIAAAKGKPVVGLETAAAQLEMLNTKPFAQQAKELYEMSLDPQKAIGQIKELSAAYKSRDTDRLFEILIEQTKEDKVFYKRLIDDRNHAWIAKLETAFKEKPTFVAVGAGHLGGANGVLQLLRAKGYQVTPVKL